MYEASMRPIRGFFVYGMGVGYGVCCFAGGFWGGGAVGGRYNKIHQSNLNRF